MLASVSSRQPSNPWGRLESRSPSTLRANLQAIGCPEHLIRNAVAAEINRSYQKRAEAIKRTPEFWSTHDARETEESAYAAAFWELEQARRVELAREVGTTITPERHWKGTKRTMLAAMQFGSLRPDVHEKVLNVFNHAWKSGDLFKRVAKGFSDEQAFDHREALYAEYERQMNQLVTSEVRRQGELFYFEVDLFDVWKDEQQFGRKLDRSELNVLREILMPPDFIANTLFSLPMTSTRDEAYQEYTVERLREAFGDELVNHYLDFRSRKP